MENEDAVIPLGDSGESGSSECCSCCSGEGGATSWLGYDGFGEVGGSWDSGGSGSAGGGRERSRGVMGSLESEGKGFSGAGEESGIEGRGLERGGAGKREYLGFLASIVRTFGGTCDVEGQSMDPRARVERVGGKCKSDSGQCEGKMQVE